LFNYNTFKADGKNRHCRPGFCPHGIMFIKNPYPFHQPAIIHGYYVIQPYVFHRCRKEGSIIMLLFDTARILGVMTLAGFLAALQLLGLFRLYDSRLTESRAKILKILTLAPPLILAFTGLIVLFQDFPEIALLYPFLAPLTVLLLWDFFDDVKNPFARRLIRLSLAAAAVLPLAAFGALAFLQTI